MSDTLFANADGPRRPAAARSAASYDRAPIHAILDEAFVCHVGFAVDGQPFVDPDRLRPRSATHVYVHGVGRQPHGRHALGRASTSVVTVTLIDGLVLARSAFHHSMNYRSVVVLGPGAARSTEPAEKIAALRRFTNHVVPGRWDGGAAADRTAS